MHFLCAIMWVGAVLNAEFVAVLSEGRVSLDSLSSDGEPGNASGVVSRVLPESREQKDVTCLALTKDFLLYGTQRGKIVMVYLAELATISEFRHDAPIVRIST